MLGIPTPKVETAHLWLWRRMPHPDTRSSGGPEIDFGIQTRHVVILGEAKWRSKVATGQGTSREESQVELRVKLFREMGPLVYPDVSHYVLLGVSQEGGMVPISDAEVGHAVLHVRDLTWEAVCSIESHPCATELRDYLAWKQRYSKPVRPRSDRVRGSG